MRARVLIVVFLVLVAVFGAGLWWFQTQAFYEELPPRDEITVQGSVLPVVEFRGIDADTSPLKLRACFRIRDGVAPDALQYLQKADNPTPLVAPDWFDCFDARAIQAGIDQGRIRAVTAERNAPWGFDRIVAAAPDGRGWMWRQINECGRAKFDGDPVPEGCPPPPPEDD
ncbi:MAG: DUF6446 family protein [Pseudomonadota bacterium]